MKKNIENGRREGWKNKFQKKGKLKQKSIEKAGNAWVRKIKTIEIRERETMRVEEIRTFPIIFLPGFP